MKLVCMILVSLVVTVSTINAQDTIIFRNGDELKAQVKEVSDRVLKYQLFSDNDGPVYIKNTTDIFMIKYSDGHKEVFSNKANLPSKNDEDNEYNEFMDMTHGKLSLHRKLLTEEEIKETFDDETYKTFTSALSQWRKGGKTVFFGFMGTVGGAMMYPVSESVAGTLSPVIFYTGIAVICLSQIGIATGFALKGIGNGRIHWVIDNYNEAHGYTENYSVKFAPTVLRTPTASGSNTLGLGAGLTFSF